VPQLGRTWPRWPCGHTNFEATSASGTSSGNISMLTTCWCEQVRQSSVTDFAPRRTSPTLGGGSVGVFCSRMLARSIPACAGIGPGGCLGSLDDLVGAGEQ
jgi:hypothetical protein